MKRLFSICMIATLLLLPLGCGGGDDTGGKTGGTTSGSTGDKGDSGDKDGGEDAKK